MDEQVILFVGDQRFLLDINEALDISRTLCSASRVTTTWLGTGSDSRNTVLGDPDPKAATIAPMTGVMQLEIDANMKALAEKNKR
jgi:hypothetical protein